MALKRKPSQRYSLTLSPATRADLNRLMKESRTCNTVSAVISGVTARYLRMLDRQNEAAGRGRVLRVYEEGADLPAVPLFELDLWL